MKAYGHLIERDGHLYVSTSRVLNDPIILRIYLATGLRVTPDTRQYVGRLVSQTDRWTPLRWHIADSKLWIDVLETAEPITEERPVPRPKTTLPVRWCTGCADGHYDLDPRWEKFSRKGWVTAGNRWETLV